jgi:hypothetical protein
MNGGSTTTTTPSTTPNTTDATLVSAASALLTALSTQPTSATGCVTYSGPEVAAFQKAWNAVNPYTPVTTGIYDPTTYTDLLSVVSANQTSTSTTNAIQQQQTALTQPPTACAPTTSAWAEIATGIAVGVGVTVAMGVGGWLLSRVKTRVATRRRG